MVTQGLVYKGCKAVKKDLCELCFCNEHLFTAPENVTWTAQLYGDEGVCQIP